MRISLLFQIKTVYKVGTMGKVYIQMVDLVANALLTLLEQNQCRRISFQKLDEYGFVESDLTSSELEELKAEAESELNGGIVLDGVLFHIPYFERIAKREKRK